MPAIDRSLFDCRSAEHEHDKAVRSIFGHPNSHLLGFLVVGAGNAAEGGLKAVPAESKRKAKQLLHNARERMKEEGRPIMSRWTAMDTNRAIREKVPGWTANLSLKHAAMAAKKKRARCLRITPNHNAITRDGV